MPKGETSRPLNRAQREMNKYGGGKTGSISARLAAGARERNAVNEKERSNLARYRRANEMASKSATTSRKGRDQAVDKEIENFVKRGYSKGGMVTKKKGKK